MPSVSLADSIHFKPPTTTKSTLPALLWKKLFPNLSTAEMSDSGSLCLVLGTEVVNLDAKTGQQIWDHNLIDGTAPITSNRSDLRPGQLQIQWPVKTGKIWLVSVSRGQSGHLLALDEHSGQVLWDYDAAGPAKPRDGLTPPAMQESSNILSEPIVWHDRAVFRAGRQLTAVRLTDGTQLWSVPMNPNGPISLAPSASPVSDEQAVYFNSDFGIAFAFDPHNGQQIWNTWTQGISITDAINVRRLNINFCFCAPLLTSGHLFVADGLGNIYALRTKDGKVLWQVHLGYTYRFIVHNTALYVATYQGFFQIDPNTGKILRQHFVPGGIVRCEIQNNVAVLTHAILPNVVGGWELFNLTQWKSVSHDSSFACRYGASIRGNILFLSGYDNHTPSTIEPEIRAYRLLAIGGGEAPPALPINAKIDPAIH